MVQFIRAEVSVHRRKQSKRSPDVLEAVKKAREMADTLRAAGVTPEQARAEFVTDYLQMMGPPGDKA